MLWEKFARSGRIIDYLRYKRSSEAVDNDNVKMLGDKRRTGRGKQ